MIYYKKMSCSILTACSLINPENELFFSEDELPKKDEFTNEDEDFDLNHEVKGKTV